MVLRLLAAAGALLLTGCASTIPAQCAPCFGGMNVGIRGVDAPLQRLTLCVDGQCRTALLDEKSPPPRGTGPVMHQVGFAGIPPGFDWARSNGAPLVVRYTDPVTGQRVVATGRIRSTPGEGTCGCPHADAVVTPA